MMTDLITGRETLEEVNMIVFCGGFSNSDVLGSAKGWLVLSSIIQRLSRHSTASMHAKIHFSLGICNGCQLMVELNLINPEHKHRAHLCHNTSKKFESSFLNLTIPQNNSVMFSSLSGNKLGIWGSTRRGSFLPPRGRR